MSSYHLYITLILCEVNFIYYVYDVRFRCTNSADREDTKTYLVFFDLNLEHDSVD